MKFGDRHSSLSIANEIEKHLINLNLYDKLITITCDGASNMRDMFTYFTRQNIKYIHCIAHKLHLIICNSLNLWVSSKKRRNTTDDEEGIETGVDEDYDDDTQASLNQMVRTMSFDTGPLCTDTTSHDSEDDNTSKVGYGFSFSSALALKIKYEIFSSRK